MIEYPCENAILLASTPPKPEDKGKSDYEYVRVNLSPSFIDYINRFSKKQDPKNEWTVRNSFMDYPPQFQEYKPKYQVNLDLKNDHVSLTFTDYLPDGVLGQTIPGYWIQIRKGLSPEMERMVVCHEIMHNIFPHLPEDEIRRLVPQFLQGKGDKDAATVAQQFIVPIYSIPVYG